LLWPLFTCAATPQTEDPDSEFPVNEPLTGFPVGWVENPKFEIRNSKFIR
jgi:hypothetical protein